MVGWAFLKVQLGFLLRNKKKTPNTLITVFPTVSQEK